MLRLSQGQLNLLETCPRKFQHIYIEQLGFPSGLEHQERLTWGSQFHLLMQQRELGLPIDYVLEDPLHQSVEAFIQAAPEVFQSSPGAIRQSEYSLTLEFQGYLLTVIYDLLIMDDRQAQILDWKTYPRPQQSRWLTKNWQTRLYPFVLAETSGYQPEQISMTYWFVRGQPDRPNQPESITYPYDEQHHQQTRQDLSHLLNQLAQWLDRYEQGESFPQVEIASGACDACSFGLRCHRVNWEPAVEPIPRLDTIEEVIL
jgi:hypothetical protein